jgi:hypothetical protein
VLPLTPHTLLLVLRSGLIALLRLADSISILSLTKNVLSFVPAIRNLGFRCYTSTVPSHSRYVNRLFVLSCKYVYDTLMPLPDQRNSLRLKTT